MHGQQTSKFVLLIFSVPCGICNFFFVIVVREDRMLEGGLKEEVITKCRRQ